MNTSDLMVDDRELRTLITIERATITRHASTNEPIETWATWKTKWWAQVQPLTGRELERAKSVDATVDHVAIIRWCDGLLPTDRIKIGTRILAIKAVINVLERNVKQVVYCTEVASA